MISLADKVVIITGASRGIGKATAELFAEHKARLALCARTKADLDKVANQLKKAAGQCFTASLDVRNEKGVKRFVKETEKRFGRIDILINNAGVGMFTPVVDMTNEDWDLIFNTNLKSAFFFCRAVIPTMTRQQSGQIINVVSGAGRTGIANLAAYCASKFGLLGFTEALGLELRPYNIKVSAILPGSVDTGWAAGSSAKRTAPNPVVKLTPREVAEGLLFLCQQNQNAWTSELNLRPHKILS